MWHGRVRGQDRRDLCLAPALDLDANAPRAQFQLFRPHHHAGDTRILEDERSNALGQCFRQLDVTTGNDGANAVHDQVVGHDVAHVLGIAGYPQDIGGDVETQG